MIAKNRELKRYCCEDISLIENYEKAIASNELYHCHHRLETDKCLSKTELIELKLYWNRPANELIFLTVSEHRKLHYKNRNDKWKSPMTNQMEGKHLSEESRKKISKSNKGRIFSDEHIKHLSESLKGHTPWNKGMKMSEETKKKISETNKGIQAGEKNPRARAVYQIDLKTDKVIRKWDYVKLVEKTLGINEGNVRCCCYGKTKHAGGFKWVYVSDYTPPAKNIHEIKPLF